MSTTKPRKIELPDYCSPFTGKSSGGDASCDHDYPREAKDEEPEFVTWTCSKCGLRRSYEVLQ